MFVENLFHKDKPHETTASILQDFVSKKYYANLYNRSKEATYKHITTCYYDDLDELRNTIKEVYNSIDAEELKRKQEGKVVKTFYYNYSPVTRPQKS